MSNRQAASQARADREARAPETVTTEEMAKLFSVLSHDLKSPIFSIDGFSDLLLADYEDRLDEEGVDFLRRIRASAGHMRRVVEEMSSIVKLLMRPNRATPVALGDVVEELRLKFNKSIEEQGVHFEVRGEMPEIETDADKFRAALTQLVSNAFQFNERPAGERTVAIEAGVSDGESRICVIDNGIGIDPRFLEQVFELGLKLDKSRGEGPGYGLFLARRIAESLGGRLEAESKPGEGSRFCLILPLRANY